MGSRDRFDIVRQSMAGIPIAFYGFAFQKAWTSIGASPTLSLSGAIGASSAGLQSAILALIFAVLFIQDKSQRFVKAALPCGIVLQILSIILMQLSPLVDTSQQYAFNAVCIIVHSAGFILLSMLWVSRWATLNPVRGAFLNAVSILIAAVITYIVVGDSPDRILFVQVTMPLLTGFCLQGASKDFKDSDTPARASKARFLVPYRAVAFIAAYSFAYGFASVAVHTSYSQYASVIPALIVIALTLIDLRKFNITLLFRLAFPLMVGGFLCFALIPGMFQPLPSIMLISSFGAMQMLLLLMVCTIAYSTGASAFWLFGIFSAAQFLMHFSGASLGALFGQNTASTEYLILEVVIIVLVVVASLMLMSEKNVFSYWGAHQPVADDAEESHEDFVKARINFLSAAYSLTDREIEVLFLLVQEKTSLQIARDMFVSEGTVRAHLHHIYQKMDVHSRSELIALVNGKG